MKLRFFDDGEAVLTALGSEYNYAVISDYPRGWKCEQTWYRTDLNDTILLKATWMPGAAEAVDLCQAWEDGYETVNKMDRTRMGRMKAAAMATRERRRALRERTSR
jgi:hypothetical protein